MLVGNHYLGEGQIQALRPRVTFTTCNLWRVERLDGVVQRFASHDKKVTFRREVYLPLGPSPSDMEQSEGGAESDFEVAGFLSSDSISSADILSHRYDGCRIVHVVVDWLRPWIWFRRHVWWISDLVEDGGVFKAQVLGVERFLSIPVGRFYERECDKVLGSLECGATPRTLFGAVVEAVASAGSPILGLPHNTMAMRFTTGSWSWSPALQAKILAQGKVRWTSGPNAGTEQTIAEHDGRDVTLETEAPFPIRAGDTAAVFSGCDGTTAACEGFYANKINHGGQKLMPSTEDQYRKPVET